MFHKLKKTKAQADHNYSTTPAMPDRRALLLGQPRQQQERAQLPDVQGIPGNDDFSLKRALRMASNTLMGIVVAFFPKCPVCWAGYMSLFGAIGLQSVPYTPQVLFLFIAGMAVNLYIQYRISRRNQRMRAFVLNLVGVAAVICGYLSGLAPISYCGIALLVVSSLFINFRRPALSRKIHQYAKLLKA